jgi:hypothetical protein
MKRHPLFGLLLAAAAAACRDAVPPFDAPELESGSDELRQLTFGTGDDMDPQWNAASDSVYYHSNLWYDRPARGSLLRVARMGGSAGLIAPEAQPDANVFVGHPALAPPASLLAYLQLVRIASPANCPELVAGLNYGPFFCPKPEPVLDSAVLRVRTPTAAGTAGEDPGVSISYPGVDPRQRRSDTTRFRQTVWPFQLDWREGNETTALRPSWSPDGKQVVFSNGLQLFLWRVAEPTASPIPNTTDGVAPAWSPDGQWIAFTLLEHGPGETIECACLPLPNPLVPANIIRHYRTWFPVTRQRIALITPSGTGLRLLTDGRDPAWTPDSRTLYYRGTTENDFAIFRLGIDGSGAGTLVPNSERGRSPSVSPDGEWLAFARRKSATGDLDIWVTRIAN